MTVTNKRYVGKVVHIPNDPKELIIYRDIKASAAKMGKGIWEYIRDLHQGSIYTPQDQETK
jgi:hypothetical protein